MAVVPAFIASVSCDADEIAGSKAQATMTAALATDRFSSSVLIMLPSRFQNCPLTAMIIAGIEMFVEYCSPKVTAGRNERAKYLFVDSWYRKIEAAG
ncbi:MAG: hypothetical protein WA635_03205 [Gallionella sp.]